MVSGLNDPAEFKSEMRRAIAYMRDKVDYLKPMIHTLKMMKNFYK